MSIDDQFDGRDIDGRLEETPPGIDSLAAGDSIDIVRHMTIDNDIDAPNLISGIGQYYVLAVIDEECEDVIELSVLNNVSSIPVFINDISCYINMKWYYYLSIDTMDTIAWDKTYVDVIYFDAPEDCSYSITSSDWITYPTNVTRSGQAVVYPSFSQNLTGLDRIGCIYAGDKDSICFLQKADIGSILPVDWLDVQATRQKFYTLVEWFIGTEFDVDEYIVQRSFDGVDFESIGTQQPFNEFSSRYDYEDELHNETVYYRIVSRDWDGSTDTSMIAALGGLEILPERFTITHVDNQYILETSKYTPYSLVNILGQEMDSDICELGQSCIISQTSKGIFFLILNVDGKQYIKKLIF